jgi:hypothetical protein
VPIAFSAPTTTIPGGGSTGPGGDGSGGTGASSSSYPVIESCWYVDPLGAITDLTTDMDRQFKDGIEGRYMTGIEHLTDSVPEMDGARYRGTRRLPRLLDIPVTFLASDTAHMRSILRALTSGIQPRKGISQTQPGRLYVTTADGISRYITCLYQKGLSQAEGGTDTANTDAVPVRTIVLEFLAFDPCWYSVEPTTVSLSAETADDSFLPMGLPMDLSSSTVVGAESITNEGDAEAYPVWVIYGPGSAPFLENATTGESLAIDVTLANGQAITVDARPGFSNVSMMDGTSLWPYTTGALFSVPPGDNEFVVSMINATEASGVVMQYQERWDSV